MSVLQIDVLQAEVTALKTLVLTSTPSSPNRQLHPQLQSSGTRGSYKSHIRNKSASGAFPLSPAKKEVSSVSIQPVSKEDREVNWSLYSCVSSPSGMRPYASHFISHFCFQSLLSLLARFSFLFSLLSANLSNLFFFSLSGVSSSLSLLLLPSSLWSSVWYLASLSVWPMTLNGKNRQRG